MGKLRHAVQIAFTALSNGYLAGFREGKIFTGQTKKLCLPGLNCYSCPGAFGSCPIGSLQAVLADRNYKFSFYIVGFLLIAGAVFGRFICGWLCPFGLVQDLLYKIPFFKKLKKLPGDRFLKYIKYVILAGFVIILPLFAVDIIGQGSPWFCKYICPGGTLMAGIPLVSSNPLLAQAAGFLFTWKLAILIILLLLSVLVYRPFCHYLCPLGAVYGLFNPISFYRFQIDEHACTKCGACKKACKLDIAVWEKPNSTECIRCQDCRQACPHSAIHSSLKRKQKRGINI